MDQPIDKSCSRCDPKSDLKNEVVRDVSVVYLSDTRDSGNKLGQTRRLWT